MIKETQQETLADIFANSERPDKITMTFDEYSKSVTVVYEDLDEEWFKELKEIDNE